MNENNIFAGLNGFIWWIGVVESRKDPLNIGRCKIRIFGWHTDDKNLIPTADLPWAQPVLPVNNAKTFNTPVEGDWVVGFFFDGPSGQVPVFFGVLPGVPTPYVDNPQKGFSDPRSDAELRSAPNLPKKNEIENDGSGTTTTNQPAQRNPFNVGYPNTNPLAINDLKNPPPSIKQRIDDITTKIAGPNSSKLSTVIAGAAQGAASALQGVTPNLQSLVPTASSLASSIIPNISSITAGITDAAKQAQAILKAQQSTLTQAQTSVTKQISEAQTALLKTQADAQASIGQSLGSLKTKASGIADEISKKLSSLAPANVSTKTPVNLINDSPNANLGAVAPGPLVNALAPNPIPAEVPLEKTGSTLQKSEENTITIFKESVTKAYNSLIQLFSSATTKNELDTKIPQIQPIWARLIGRTGEIAEVMGDPEIKTELDNFVSPLRANLNAAKDAAYARLKA